jgi:hypothetical protein
MAVWASTWPLSALRAAGIEPTPYARRTLALWNKSTPTEPWTRNPIGIPAKGYGVRKVPNTEYALFLSQQEFNDAFVKAMSGEAGGRIPGLIQSGESPAKLWRAVNGLPWPAAKTEGEWPYLLYVEIGEEYRKKLGVKDPQPSRSSGSHGYNPMANMTMHQHMARMGEAISAKLDLASAIRHTLGSSGRNGR